MFMCIRLTVEPNPNKHLFQSFIISYRRRAAHCGGILWWLDESCPTFDTEVPYRLSYIYIYQDSSKTSPYFTIPPYSKRHQHGSSSRLLSIRHFYRIHKK